MNIQMEIEGECGVVKSAHGEIEFTLDNESISVFQILVLKRRCGIGSALLKRLEDFCLQQDIRKVTVPSTPSKEALSFWLARGYHYVFPEDSNIGHQIQNSLYPEKIVETDSGIILLEKIVSD